ncbi:MAG: prephenate dehydrogenase [Flavobacteriaceae bacterium]|nr:prephenate dehydrogenase [Flavobacteriaceae bacterium]
MNVFVIGIGLIGGSLAKDIKMLYPQSKLFGIDSSEMHLKQAFSLNIIDEMASMDDLYKADWVIVAVPVDVAVSLVPEVLDKIPSHALVLEVGSTKAALCKAISKHKNRRNLLATHPIAGTEFSGPKAAHCGLFKGKTNIICEIDKTAFPIQEKALKLFAALEMHIRYMKPKAHDKHIAYVSHLSHISSFMLGKTVIEKEQNERDIFDLAGSGFESTVRLAKSSPAMWTPIFKQNKTNIIGCLEEYIRNLKQFKKLIENDKYDPIFKELESTNKIKEILNGIQFKQ